MKKLSICIPTYNRAILLSNCLNSIVLNKNTSNLDFEVCVSDNCSTDFTEQVVSNAQKDLNIKYQKNSQNMGMTNNFLKVVEMAEGEFIWLIGDDDLFLPNSIESLFNLFKKYPSTDFFYINSFHLTTNYIFSFEQPFNTENLPANMKRVSSFSKSSEMSFFNLIDPKISFDFLGGIFLSVFKKSNWLENYTVLCKEAINDKRTFSHFDNTFPHLKIFSKAFANSNAYFYAEPLSVCLSGAREWYPMQPLVMSVRLIEALENYKKNGLPYIKYIYCKNFALKNFIPDLGYMLLNKNTGLEYINPIKLIFKNFLYPNFYFSILYFIIRKLRKLIFKI